MDFRIRPLIFSLILCSTASFTTHAQLAYGTTVSGVLTVPTGKYADAFSLGYGGHVEAFFDVESNVRITLGGGYLYSPIDKAGVQELYSSRGGTGTLDPDGSTRTIPLLIGVQMITPGPRVRMFGLIEGGLFIYRVGITGTITDQNGTTSIPFEEQFRTEPGVNFGFGVLLPLGEPRSLSAVFRYHLVKDSDYSGQSGSELSVTTSQFFSLNIGLNYSFLSQ